AITAPFPYTVKSCSFGSELLAGRAEFPGFQRQRRGPRRAISLEIEKYAGEGRWALACLNAYSGARGRECYPDNQGAIHESASYSHSRRNHGHWNWVHRYSSCGTIR